MKHEHDGARRDEGLLPAALAGIAAGAGRTHDARAAVGGGVDVARALADARRRRTRFTAGVGLAAAGVVAALAVGGTALGRLDAPVPPVVTPPAEGVGCGTVLGDLVQPDGGPDVGVTVEPRATEVRAGDPLSALVVVTVAGAGPDDAFGHMTSLALARDGVVVGVASRPPDLAPGPTDTPQRQAGTATVTFTGCGADGEPADTLPPGDYDLVAIADDVMLADGTTWPTPFVSDPVAVTVVEAATGLPACGEPTSGLAPTVGAVTATPGVRVGTVEAGGFVHDGRGDALAVLVGLSNDGPDLQAALGVQLEMAVAQDGVVVASWAGEHTDPAPEDWPALGWRTADWSGQVARCGAGAGDDLGPGRYVLWVRATTSAADRPDGEPAPVVVVAPPVEFTVRTADDPTDPEVFGPDVDAEWPFVDPSDVPGGLAFTLDPADEVVAAQAGPDGRRWRLSVAHAGGRATYGRLLGAAVAAGYDVVREETDPERPFWAYAQLRRDDLLVALEVSNETGGGFYATWLVVRTD